MQLPASVNIAVPGKFHVLNYAPFLSDQFTVNRLWFSHKPKSLLGYGLSPLYARNYPLSEILIQGHSRAFRGWRLQETIPYYHKLWSLSASRDWIDCGILHVINMGASACLINRARGSRSKILCEVVNTHPEFRQQLLEDERQKWKISSPRKALTLRERLQIEESKQADFLLAPSQIVATSYRDYGFNQPIYVIPYAANLTHFKPQTNVRKAQEKKLSIISVGRIGLRKGQLYILEAVKLLRQHFDISLTLVGTIDPEIRQHLEAYSDLFHHIERVPHQDMANLLSLHDVYISTSIEEGLSVSICEAMACGLTVLATPESGAEELITSGQNGILFQSKSTEALVDALETILQSPSMRDHLGTGAQMSSAETHNWEQYARALAGVYRNILSC